MALRSFIFVSFQQLTFKLGVFIGLKAIFTKPCWRVLLIGASQKLKKTLEGSIMSHHSFFFLSRTYMEVIMYLSWFSVLQSRSVLGDDSYTSGEGGEEELFLLPVQLFRGFSSMLFVSSSRMSVENSCNSRQNVKIIIVIIFAQFTFNLFLGFSYEQDFSSEPEAYLAKFSGAQLNLFGQYDYRMLCGLARQRLTRYQKLGRRINSLNKDQSSSKLVSKN